MHTSKSPAFARHLAALGAALGLLAALPAAHADVVWTESYTLDGILDGPYTASVVGNVVHVLYQNQTVVNTGATGHVGMYYGWSWMRPADAGSSSYQALGWDNSTQRFTDGTLSMQIQHDGFTDQFLTIGDVLGDTWIGQGWSPDGVIPEIATDAGWAVPLFDFGVVAAGASVSYDVRYTFTLADGAAAQAFLNAGGFHSYAQGLVGTDGVVPEPTTLALVGLGLLAASATRRRR